MVPSGQRSGLQGGPAPRELLAGGGLEESEEGGEVLSALENLRTFAKGGRRGGLLTIEIAGGGRGGGEGEKLIKDLKRYARLAVAWSWHGFPVPRLLKRTPPSSLARTPTFGAPLALRPWRHQPGESGGRGAI